jgi:hypothetical protein
MNFQINPISRNVLAGNSEAAYRQTPAQHDELLHQFERPGMTPMELMAAQLQGEEAEAAEPRYWLDQTPRRDLGVGSSWIKNVEYLPESGIAIITMPDGKNEYRFLDSDTVGDFITSDSLGNYFNRFLREG